MTDNTNTTPADDVLARAKELITFGDDMSFDHYATHVVRLVPQLVAALDAALARNRELEAQIARLREAGREMLPLCDRLTDVMLATDGTVETARAKIAEWRELFADDAVAEWRDSSGNERPVRAAGEGGVRRR